LSGTTDDIANIENLYFYEYAVLKPKLIASEKHAQFLIEAK